jgi:hypothetical protein
MSNYCEKEPAPGVTKEKVLQGIAMQGVELCTSRDENVVSDVTLKRPCQIILSIFNYYQTSDTIHKVIGMTCTWGGEGSPLFPVICNHCNC